MTGSSVHQGIEAARLSGLDFAGAVRGSVRRDILCFADGAYRGDPQQEGHCAQQPGEAPCREPTQLFQKTLYIHGANLDTEKSVLLVIPRVQLA